MRRVHLLFLTIGILLSSLGSALASAQLSLSDGTTTIVVTDGDINDQNSAVGIVYYNGPVGTNWYINVTVGITKPTQGSASQPFMDLDTKDVSHGPGDLTVKFTDTDYILSSGSFDAQAGGTTDGTVEMKYYVDGSDTPFGAGTLLGDLAGLVDVFAADTNGTFSVGSPLSMTVEADIHHPKAGSTGFDELLVLTNSPPPNIICPPDRDIGCNPTNIPSCDTNSVKVTSSCGVSSITCSAAADIVTGCIHERDITYTVTDFCGQNATCTQHIYWTIDTTAPVFTTCPTNIDLGCNPSSIPSCDVSQVSATDDCGRPSITCTNVDTATGCNHTRTIVYTATDKCLNSSTCVQLITWVIDTTPPTLTCPDSLTLTSTDRIPDPDPKSASATDDCSKPTITYVGGTTNGNCPTTITRTYKATDACGNTATCSQTITVTCEEGGCRVTGGSNHQTNSYQSDCITNPLPTYISHGGQVGASFADETPFTPNDPCIRGEWQHNRHLSGNSLVGVLHAAGNGSEHDFDSHLCACLPCPENPGAVGVVGSLCNPDDRICGPEPRRAPANKICFSGVGDYTFTQGNKTVKAVFRVDISDRGEGNSQANPAPLDRYRIRIWVLDPACGRNPDPNSAEAMAIRYAASADPNQIGVLATTENLKVNIPPDIDDGGDMIQGNHQLHPETGATCTAVVPVLAPASIDVKTEIAPLISGGTCNFGLTAKGYQGAQNPSFVYRTTVTNCGSLTLSNLSVVNATDTITDNTSLYFAPGATLAPGQWITRYYTNTCTNDTPNLVTVVGYGNGSSTFAAGCAMASVVPAAMSCTVTLSSASDLDGAVNNHLTLAPGTTASVTESVTVCNIGSSPITGATITDGLLGLTWPAFDLAPGACTTVSGTKSLACPSALATKTISVSAGVACNCTPPTIPVTASTTVGYEPQKAGPTDLAVSSARGKLVLTWTALAEATSYNVKRSTSATGPFTTLASGVITTTYTDNPPNNTTCYYVVSAMVGGVETANSAAVASSKGK